MARFPGYGLPFQYYSPYRRNNFYNNYKPSAPVSNPPVCDSPIVEEKTVSSHSRSSSNHKKPAETVWFDLFGIKLYFDDVLILSLLFFLYKEEVKDEGLFLALVLLLIS